MGIKNIVRDKRGVQLQSAFFAILVFSAVIISTGVIVNEWSDKYSTGVTSDLEKYNTLDSVYGDIQSQKGKVTPNDPSPGENSESNTFRGVYGIVTGVLGSFKLVYGTGGMLDSIAIRFKIPTFIIQVIAAMMIFSLIAAIIGIIFRLGRTP